MDAAVTYRVQTGDPGSLRQRTENFARGGRSDARSHHQPARSLQMDPAGAHVDLRVLGDDIFETQLSERLLEHVERDVASARRLDEGADGRPSG